MITQNNTSIAQMSKKTWTPKRDEFSREALKKIDKHEEKTKLLILLSSSIISGIGINIPNLYNIDSETNIMGLFLLTTLSILGSYAFFNIIKKFTTNLKFFKTLIEKSKNSQIEREIEALRSLENFFPKLTEFFDSENIFQKIQKEKYESISFSSSEKIPFERLKATYDYEPHEVILELFIRGGGKPVFSLAITQIPGEHTYKVLRFSFSENWILEEKEKIAPAIENILIIGSKKLNDALNKKEINLLERKLIDHYKTETSKTTQKILEESLELLNALPNIPNKDYSDAKRRALIFFETLYKNFEDIEPEKISVLESQRDTLKKYNILLSLETENSGGLNTLEDRILKHLTYDLEKLQNNTLLVSDESKNKLLLTFKDTFEDFSHNTLLKSIDLQTSSLVKIDSTV